jgi:hypothetical protein
MSRATLGAKQETEMSQVKRDWERWEDLKADVAAVAVGTGALQYAESDE